MKTLIYFLLWQFAFGAVPLLALSVQTGNLDLETNANTRPVLLSGGNPVPAGSGFAAVGTFQSLTDGEVKLASLAELLGDFLQFGESKPIGAGGFDGLYTNEISISLAEGNSHVGKRIHTVIGNGPDLGSSTELLVVVHSGEDPVLADTEPLQLREALLYNPDLSPFPAVDILIGSFGAPADLGAPLNGLIGFSMAAVVSAGDMNGDGVVNSNDIEGFILAFVDPQRYSEKTGRSPLVADINDDGLLDALDIDGFVALLTGAAPENQPQRLAQLAALHLPDSDNDGDGMLNSGELLAGTDPTRWSVVLQAQDVEENPSAEEERREALAVLCETYWFPIYAFVRRSGAIPEDAEDTTQHLFLHLIEKGALGSVAKEKGRFRSFLLAVVKNLMAGERRRQLAQRRGGGQRLESLEDLQARGEEDFLRQPGHELTPEKLFEKRWAESVFDRAIERLRDDWVSSGRDFDGIKNFLTGAKGDESYAAAAARLEITVVALKARVHRLRLRFREVFREEVAHTVKNPEDVDAEIEHIRNALRG